MSGICTTRGVPFEPSAAAKQRAMLRDAARARRDEEERAYREHVPEQVVQQRRREARERRERG